MTDIHRPRRARRRLGIPLVAAASAAVLVLAAVPAQAAATPGTATGKVVAADSGKPVASSTVTLWDADGPYGTPSPVRATSTRKDGSYTLDLRGIRSASYEITAGPYRGSGSPYARVQRHVPGTVTAASSFRQDFSVPRAGKISGRVSPKPQDGRYVYALLFATGSNKADDSQSAAVDQDGSFTTEGVAPGTYKVQFVAPQASGLANRFHGGASDAAHAATVTVRAGQTTTGVGTTLVRGAEVSGRITAADTKKGLAGVAVELTSTDAAHSNTYRYWGADYSSQTGSDGSYDFTGVAPGKYTVHFDTNPQDAWAPNANTAKYVPQYLGSRFASSAKVLTVTGTGKQTASVALQRGAAISGTLSASASSRFDVRAYAKDPKTAKWVPVSGQAVSASGTAKSAKYSIPGLAKGSYKVGYRDYSTSATLPDGYWKDKTTLAAAGTVSVPATGTVGKVDQTLRWAFAAAPTPTVRGTVKVGSTLTAAPGTWVPVASKTAYQWKRAGKAISGATGAKYKLTKADKGKAVTVTVSGSRSGYTTIARTSRSVTPKS